MGTVLTRSGSVAGWRAPLAAVAVLVALLAACGDEDRAASGDGRPRIVVTTSILGDVIGDLVGDRAEVITIMPPGADPHTFQPSARQVAAAASADALVVNGAGFEAGLRSVVDNAAAEGVPVHEAISAVDTLTVSEPVADPHDDAAPDEAHGEEDPHFFTDPTRMVDAVRGIAAYLRETVPALDDDRLEQSTADLVADLERLDGEIADILDAVPDERRVLVTDHEVFRYFVDRYDFDIVGVVVPPGSSADGVSGGALARLADAIREAGVSAIFVSSGHSADLADTLAGEVGDVRVVELFAESLGPGGSAADTYRGMMLTNAERISDALAP